MAAASQRVCVVTGANKGIGFQVVREMCNKWDGIVYLTSRNEQRGMAALNTLKSEGLAPRYHQLDLCDEESVLNLKNHLQSTHGGFDILINNAGFAFKAAATEPFAEQAVVTIDINYYGTLRVVQNLKDILKPNGKVINTSSMAGFLAKMVQPGPLKDRFLNPELTYEQISELMQEFKSHAAQNTHKQAGWPNSTYCASKLGVSAMARVLQREFDNAGKNQIANHLHPGYVNTDMTSGKGRFTLEQGAASTIFCALLPTDTNIRGAYVWEDCRIFDWATGEEVSN